MSTIYSSSFEKKNLLYLHGNRMNLLRRDHHRHQYIVGALASRHMVNYNDNLITHQHRMRQLYSPICEHETRHCHEIANHYKDWCRKKIGRRAKKRVVGARTAVSCLPEREVLRIPCFDYPRYADTAAGLKRHCFYSLNCPFGPFHKCTRNRKHIVIYHLQFWV